MDEITAEKRQEILKRGLSTKEAAAYIGKTRKTLDNYRSLETGPHYWKIEKTVIYDPVDLDDYLEAKMVKVNTTYYSETSLIISKCRGDLSEIE